MKIDLNKYTNVGKRALLGGCVVAAVLATTALAGSNDDLGTSWDGCEYGSTCEWHFHWTRVRGDDNVFNGYWRHSKYPSFQGKIRISISGSTVTVNRPALGGAPPCTYTGTYHVRDLTNGIPPRVRGTYTCGTYTGPWHAEIRR